MTTKTTCLAGGVFFVALGLSGAARAAAAEVNVFKNEGISALIAQNPRQEGEVAMEAAAKLLKGQSLEKTMLTEIATITSEDTAAAQKYEYKGDCQ